MARAFVAHSAGFREIANSPQMRKALAEVAEKAKVFAESISADFTVTGDYERSFEVREVTVEWAGNFPGPRAAVQLANTSGHAAAVEYGFRGRAEGKTGSAHRVLGRTLEFLDADGRL